MRGISFTRAGTRAAAPSGSRRSMETSIFRFVLRYSRREQIQLLLLTLAAFPFLYVSLDLPKTIINEAIAGRDFPQQVFGHELDQVPYLMVLCAAFLVLVFVNGGFKYAINVYRGVVGERMLRRLRYQLYEHVLRFPPPQFRKLSQGEIVSMVTAETEDIGGFIGDSVALPAFQGGTLLTILIFMFVQDAVLGTAAIALYPMQAWLIPKFQRRVNELKKERVLKVRKLSERIGEVVTGVREVHTHDTSQYELADYSQRIGEIFYIRFEIYKQKFLIKFLNNFIAQITPFFFYSIGGYLVIKGDLSFGALVAVLAAYKDLSAPWKELLNYYQLKEDARVKYELLREIFEPPGLVPADKLYDDAEASALEGAMVASNVDLSDLDGIRSFPSGASFSLDLPCTVAVLGDEASGRQTLAEVITGLMRPLSGSVTVAGVDLVKAPEAVTGRRLAYVGAQPFIRAGTLRENLSYALLHRPVAPPEVPESERARRDRERRETDASGNSPYEADADWIDYTAAGVEGPEILVERVLEVLRVVRMEQDVYELGLQGHIDPERHVDLAKRILVAREAMRARLDEPEYAKLVEPFDQDAYNTNMSVAENLLFGAPKDTEFSVDRLPYNEQVGKILRDFGLEKSFVDIGRQVAEIMLDLFADVEPGSPLFEQFSFISAEDLPLFRGVLSRTDGKSADELSGDDRRQLLSLPFRLVVARHRLGLIDAGFQKRIVEARQVMLERFGTEQGKLEPFDTRQVNSAVSIQDNILFGRLVYGRARSAAQVGALVREVVEKLDLREALMEVGLDFPVGIAGSRLSAAQRQKLAIARAVLKRPDVLVLDEATASLDESSQHAIMRNLLEEFSGRSLFWLLHRASLAADFDRVLVIDEGKVVEQGTFRELSETGGAFSRMLEAHPT
jgi:ABC-type multidrug transport system fused ATPase/permease subunit